jgi:hypothetical protein
MSHKSQFDAHMHTTVRIHLKRNSLLAVTRSHGAFPTFIFSPFTETLGRGVLSSAFPGQVTPAHSPVRSARAAWDAWIISCATSHKSRQGSTTNDLITWSRDFDKLAMAVLCHIEFPLGTCELTVWTRKFPLRTFEDHIFLEGALIAVAFWNLEQLPVGWRPLTHPFFFFRISGGSESSFYQWGWPPADHYGWEEKVIGKIGKHSQLI